MRKWPFLLVLSLVLLGCKGPNSLEAEARFRRELPEWSVQYLEHRPEGSCWTWNASKRGLVWRGSHFGNRTSMHVWADTRSSPMANIVIAKDEITFVTGQPSPQLREDALELYMAVRSATRR